jgi:dTDP-4-dehydrorhamnose reductase
MRILVSGAAGMVGSAVKEVFKHHDLLLTDIKEMDVRDYDIVMSYADTKPNLILHLAAETNLEVCKSDPGNAYLTNHTGTVHMRLLSEMLDIPVVYISTAGIFDGQKNYYHEWDRPGAINHYGRSKWFGEIALEGYRKKWIFRAGWMMGGGPNIDKKFVNIIYKKIKSGAKELCAVDDAFGCPTYTYDLASTIWAVLEQKSPYGVYHCGGGGVASRYDVACAVVEFLKADVKVIPVKDGYFDKEFHCKRSKSEVMANVKLNGMAISKMRNWRVSLKEYIENCYTL